jgi:hypothetical protein
VFVLAACGAAAGAWAGRRIAPDESAVTVAVAVAGFGLGGLIGMIGLGLRALVMRALRVFDRSRDAAAAPPALAPQDGPPPAPVPPPAPGPEPAPAAGPEPQPATGPEPAAAPGPRGAAEPGPEREPPAPPAGEEPGWYPDPHQPGRNRYWDGQTWTAHVSRDRGPRRGAGAPRS